MSKNVEKKEPWELCYEVIFEKKHLDKYGMPTVPAVSVPFDPRFPNTNQTRNCWQNFVDYHRCKNRYGEERKECKYFRWAFTELCATEYVDKWTDQIEEGKFAAKLD